MDILAALAGVCLAGIGLIAMVLGRPALKRSEPVALRVVALHEGVDSDSNTIWNPEFLVLSGPHEGARFISDMGEERPLHSVDDHTSGRIDPLTGHIASDAEVSMYRWMPVWALVIGIGLCGVAAFQWI